MEEVESSNFQLFRDCLSTPLIEKSTEANTKSKKARHKSGRKAAIKPVSLDAPETSDAEDLAEFIDYLASEIFLNLPVELRTLTYSTWLNTPTLQLLYPNPPEPKIFAKTLHAVPIHVSETLETYLLLPLEGTRQEFLLPILIAYLSSVLTAPPPPSQTRATAAGCEICERSWIPLTFHHLIPRAAHAKALKRGWHTEDQLESVAWLCRACHSFVHRVASNEELAREYWSVERLLGREDVQRFAGWAGKIRWKAK